MSKARQKLVRKALRAKESECRSWRYYVVVEEGGHPLNMGIDGCLWRGMGSEACSNMFFSSRRAASSAITKTVRRGLAWTRDNKLRVVEKLERF